MKNKLTTLCLVVATVVSCHSDTQVESRNVEFDVAELESRKPLSLLGEDPEVDQLRVDFAKACPFPSYTCKLANPLNDVYRETHSGMPVAVPFGSTASFPESWIAKWCAATTPSKVHVDFVRYPADQTVKRVYACVMDDYSPGATK